MTLGKLIFPYLTILLQLTSIAVSSDETPKSPKNVKAQEKPHIILIIADDMGWNDVSFHGSDQIPTPNIDALAYNGVILNSHYVSAMCTPSRAALLTGKLPIHTGMQHLVILEAEPRGLPLTEKILPEYLREAGYKTHAIGKWHQGFHRREYTPLYRGFDSHFGYYQGLQDYYTHEVASSHPEEGFIGFDMRRNMSVARDTANQYSTDLFSSEAERLISEHDPKGPPMFLYLSHLAPHSGNDRDPLQAPDAEVAKFAYIRDAERRIYAAMMSKLDESVGRVVGALRHRGMLDNSIVVFMADNGAATHGIHYNRGSNYPLRGIKGSAWEGAVRGAAAVWSPLIERKKRVSNDLMYIADWLPTLFAAAGLKAPEAFKTLDAVDLWPSISRGESSPRSELLVNIDPIFNYSAVRVGDFKYVRGSVGNGDGWYGETGRPGDRYVEGHSPDYDPEQVLRSAAGAAIAGLLTQRQMSELRRIRSTSYERVQLETEELLTPGELVELRSKATLNCTIKEQYRVPCNPIESACVFNIKDDPCEMVNLAGKRQRLVERLEHDVLSYLATAVPPSNVPNDPLANPKLWEGTWVSWLDADPREFLVEHKEKSYGPITGPTIAVLGVVIGLAVAGIFVLGGFQCNRDEKSEKKSLPNRRNEFQKVGTSERNAPDSEINDVECGK